MFPLSPGMLDALEIGVIVLDDQRQVRHWNALGRGACDKDAAASGYPVLRKPVTPDQLQTAILQRIAEVSLGGVACVHSAK